MLLCQGGADAAAQTADSLASVRDGVYSDAQAERGKALYDEECDACHAPEYFTDDSFIASWSGAPLSTLFGLISSSMPQDRPGSLRPAEYSAVIAYILHLNGLPSGTDSLPSDEGRLQRILIRGRSR